ncbi:MAG: RnfABCDGE type electron transport complex subunit D, partial [Eubacteriales bacterium]|nr:RnfABCDGE type electron transport complex subunit D [Eubacteriales bacterium]
GEVSAVALLIGAAYLWYRGVISLRVPLCYIGTVFVITMFVSGFNFTYSLAQILAGGLILGAFFMANDYTTSPVTAAGQIIMGIGCGVLTVIIRQLGGYPEGVTYSILLMNLTVPLIERVTRPRALGEAGGRPRRVKKEGNDA